MNVTHTLTADGRPLTIATYDGMSARLPGHLSPDAVKRQLNIYRALVAQR